MEEVWEAAGTQSETTYIGLRQGTMVQWVALRLIFEVLTRDNGYEGEGSGMDAWWHHKTPDTQLREILKDISW